MERRSFLSFLLGLPAAAKAIEAAAQAPAAPVYPLPAAPLSPPIPKGTPEHLLQILQAGQIRCWITFPLKGPEGSPSLHRFIFQINGVEFPTESLDITYESFDTLDVTTHSDSSPFVVFNPPSRFSLEISLRWPEISLQLKGDVLDTQRLLRFSSPAPGWGSYAWEMRGLSIVKWS